MCKIYKKINKYIADVRSRRTGREEENVKKKYDI